jgi:NitT/TauT family transport system permease protein
VQLTFIELVDDTWSQKKPKLPAPHQVGQEMWKTIFYKKVTSKRSLVYHGWITLSATLSGFLLGTILGICLALAIVHDKATDLSVMPWIITSQTIPILALAPMIIVVLSSIGFTGLMPKAVISMYLSFFPIVVGMVKGLRSPDLLEIDQMKTWSASRFQILMKLRFPKSIPYLFTSLKLGMAASLVGAIVGELPSGAIAGLGARMLSGSYYGQTIQIWSALFTAAILAASLVGLIGAIQSLVSKRMMVTQ